MIRISTKLTVAVSLAITLVTVANALQRVHRESELFEGDVRRDHQVLGSALAETTATLTVRAGVEEALLALEEVNRRRAHVGIRWVFGEGEAERSRIIETGDGRYLQTHVPVVTPSGPMGYIQLSESLAPHDRYMRESIVRVGAWALLSILASALLVHLAGIVILARPLRPILAKMQRVGEGDLGTPLALVRNDELGIIGRELDEMCRRLAEVQAEMSAETEARIAALEQLRHADRLGTVGKLASGVAHELGTPLNVVSARAKMIQRGESEGEEARDDARVIGEQTERMTRIIRQLLDFARRRPPARESADLRQLASSILTMLQPLAAREGVELHLSASDPVDAEVDVGQIQQVLSNLIINAIQAQPDGGRIDIELESDQTRVRIVVSDRGPGIDPSIASRIFEPFFTTKDVGEGTGLGLSVVHGIVAEHGGRIDVGAADGGGARFVVDLPRGRG